MGPACVAQEEQDMVSTRSLAAIRGAGALAVWNDIPGLGGDWRVPAYNTAKGAVMNLTNAMALDHAADGVRVNAVHPSLTVTEMAAPNLENEQVLEAFKQRIALGRPA
jgi:meso-butanediol dehydrogenase / (S,S)-butanediol dehydrogenase / diacetyl reductase